MDLEKLINEASTYIDTLEKKLKDAQRIAKENLDLNDELEKENKEIKKEKKALNKESLDLKRENDALSERIERMLGTVEHNDSEYKGLLKKYRAEKIDKEKAEHALKKADLARKIDHDEIDAKAEKIISLLSNLRDRDSVIKILKTDRDFFKYLWNQAQDDFHALKKKPEEAEKQLAAWKARAEKLADDIKKMAAENSGMKKEIEGYEAAAKLIVEEVSKPFPAAKLIVEEVSKPFIDLAESELKSMDASFDSLSKMLDEELKNIDEFLKRQMGLK